MATLLHILNETDGIIHHGIRGNETGYVTNTGFRTTVASLGEVSKENYYKIVRVRLFFLKSEAQNQHSHIIALDCRVLVYEDIFKSGEVRLNTPTCLRQLY